MIMSVHSPSLARRNFLRAAVASAVVLPMSAALTSCVAGEVPKSDTTPPPDQPVQGERRRNALFDSDFHDRFGQWPVGYIPAGGADMGDVIAVAAAVGSGDDTAYYEAFVGAGDAKVAEAEKVLAAGHKASARSLYLRASCMYAAAYHPIYGTPVDPRLLTVFDKQMDAFQHAMELSRVPVRPTAIPFEGMKMPAYFVPATGYETEVRPLVILTNGYDATITDLYFASGVAALERGYHVLMFDGPGQGGMLYRQGIPLRHDWEVVVSAVVDHAEKLSLVDPKKIVLSGWSLGGYLAPRAATAEPRLAACIADPGQWDMAESMVPFVAGLTGTDPADVDLENLDDKTIDTLWSAIQSDRELYWTIVQRGFWANGVSDLRGFIGELSRFTLKDIVTGIRCPMLLTAAEDDPLADSTKKFYDALTSDKTLLEFTTAEGTGDHVEMNARSTVNRRVLDWLDETLSMT